eukprot:2621068-Amphidinium_carterae.1
MTWLGPNLVGATAARLELSPGAGKVAEGAVDSALGAGGWDPRGGFGGARAVWAPFQWELRGVGHLLAGKKTALVPYPLCEPCCSLFPKGRLLDVRARLLACLKHAARVMISQLIALPSMVTCLGSRSWLVSLDLIDSKAAVTRMLPDVLPD